MLHNYLYQLNNNLSNRVQRYISTSKSTDSTANRAHYLSYLHEDNQSYAR